MFDPIAAPVATVGPSNPTEPPKPTVREDVSIEPHIWKRLIIPSRFDIEYNVVGIPWLTSLRTTYLITR